MDSLFATATDMKYQSSDFHQSNDAIITPPLAFLLSKTADSIV